ncbi:methionyl aminopeptidase [Gordonibacter sp. Marseille-P4307]|uniref:methionyl aminopeptidase n=1 Tax=Gordonibacter sp. Marseille-P4307 TaxID=2161815 RepID=UPI000F535B26|nr:methionyl aminopeptidase [Gordonibacter sp. Marseille-P4307]
MYDGIESPGRNDECWCGSGKKYKKCHRDFDDKLQQLWDEGEEVLARSLLKTPADIEGIKLSAKVNVGALDYVEAHIKAGVTTADIDRWVHDYCIERGAVPADLNYEGFPKSVCTSVNEVVCHGIPSEDEVLREGDIVNVDMSTILGGYFSDSSRMFCIGEVDPEWRRLVEVTKRSVEAGMSAVRPWAHLGDVSAAVNKVATDAGFSVVREFGGHGCGIEFHEDPFVSFVELAGTGPILVPGMCFTIEPMVNMGTADIDMSDPNGWTVRTADGLPSAQWEVQVAVTESGFELISW